MIQTINLKHPFYLKNTFPMMCRMLANIEIVYGGPRIDGPEFIKCERWGKWSGYIYSSDCIFPHIQIHDNSGPSHSISLGIYKILNGLLRRKSFGGTFTDNARALNRSSKEVICKKSFVLVTLCDTEHVGL
jgi:hypothetical protein